MQLIAVGKPGRAQQKQPFRQVWMAFLWRRLAMLIMQGCHQSAGSRGSDAGGKSSLRRQQMWWRSPVEWCCLSTPTHRNATPTQALTGAREKGQKTALDSRNTWWRPLPIGNHSALHFADRCQTVEQLASGV